MRPKQADREQPVPFNYLSTVINIEPDTQPGERERGESEMGGEKERRQTTEGGTAKICLENKFNLKQCLKLF